MDRADVVLVKLGLAKSRTYAKEIIEQKRAFVDGKLIEKPSQIVDEELVTINSVDSDNYVGRGAKKLIEALNVFEIDVKNSVCMDIGASTGGFTQILLENDAKKIFAIDVGSGQLADKLLNNKRVVNLENTNFRYLDFEKIGEKIDFVCIDVSFISLKHIFLNLKNFANENTKIVALIKPQFECSKVALNKKGIVKSEKYFKEAISNVKDYALINGFKIMSIIDSPILGGDGNREFLSYIRME